MRINQLGVSAARFGLLSGAVLGALLAALIGLLGALAAQAEPTSESGPTDVDRRWIPSLSFEGGAAVQHMNAGVSSQCLNGRQGNPITLRPSCRDPLGRYSDVFVDEDNNLITNPDGSVHVFAPTDLDNPLGYAMAGATGPLRKAVDDGEIAVTPFVSAALQLLTPRVDVVPGGPRAFLSGEIITFWGQDLDIAREGNASGVAFPDPAEAGSATQNVLGFSENGLFGSGSRTRSTVQTLGFGARAGLAFPFQFRERRIWIKPFVGWIQYDVEVEGRVVAGLKDDGALQAGDPPPGLPNGINPATLLSQLGNFLVRGPGVRQVSLRSTTTETYNGVGPGLEVEMETGRFGPLGVSIFFGFGTFRVFGDRKVEINDSVRCDPPAIPCPSSIVNDITRFDDLQPLSPIQPNPNPPPPFIRVPAPEDVVSPAGPVPDAGIVYPDPPADPVAPIMPFGPDTYTASWDFEVDEWGYRGGVGIRLHWLGR